MEYKKSELINNVEYFIRWEKITGGEWWAYKEEILPGEYSDDTQLTLAVVRSIRKDGSFDPEYFVNELVLWPDYARGAGRSVKSAAENLRKIRVKWNKNIFKNNKIAYVEAGANGAAMRTLPISLINIDKEKKFIVEAIKNAIITHGHPRAIIGAVIIGCAQIYLIRNGFIKNLLNYIKNAIDETYDKIFKPKDAEIEEWLSVIKKGYDDYEREFIKCIRESVTYLDNIDKYLNEDDKEYYYHVRALEPKYFGSGISTTCISLYLFHKYLDRPWDGLIRSANFKGSDTDTISSMYGSLIGGCFGFLDDSRVNRLIEGIQDKLYIEKLARFLFEIATNYSQSYDNLNLSGTPIMSRKEIIKSWECEKEEFERTEKYSIRHPTLGLGCIVKREILPLLKKKNYVLDRYKVNFDCGQSVYFRSIKKAVDFEV